MRIERKLEVKNTLGLHARAATKLVKLSNRFVSHIELIKDDQKADAKSIMSILMLAAAKGSQLVLIVEGEDAQQAAQQIMHLFEQCFGEIE